MKQLAKHLRQWIGFRLVLLAACVVVVIGVVFLVRRLMANSTVGVVHTQHIVITPVQVEKIRSIGQWEFLAVADEEMVDTVRHGFFGDDELARIYYGTLRLGIDLRQTPDGWITMDADTVCVLLPPVSLLDNNFLDEARTKTFYEDGKWTEADKAALTGRARVLMKHRCLTTANLRCARENASAQFSGLLKAMGFEYSRIRFRQ